MGGHGLAAQHPRAIMRMPGENPSKVLTADTAVAPTAPTRAATTWSVWLCPLVSGGLLYLAYFPVAWGWLGWVALVPLLVLVRLGGRASAAAGRPRFLYLS